MAKAPKRASDFTLVMVKTHPHPLKEEKDCNLFSQKPEATMDLWTAEELSCQEISSVIVLIITTSP